MHRNHSLISHCSFIPATLLVISYNDNFISLVKSAFYQAMKPGRFSWSPICLAQVELKTDWALQSHFSKSYPAPNNPQQIIFLIKLGKIFERDSVYCSLFIWMRCVLVWIYWCLQSPASHEKTWRTISNQIEQFDCKRICIKWICSKTSVKRKVEIIIFNIS